MEAVKLTLKDYYSLEEPVRKALRRKAFGCPRHLPPQLEGKFDLEHLRTILVQENEATGEFAIGGYINSKDPMEDLAAEEAERGPADVVDMMRRAA